MTYRAEAVKTAANELHHSRGLLHRLFWRDDGDTCAHCECVVWPAIRAALPVRPPRIGRPVVVEVTADTSQLQRQLQKAADALREARRC